MLAPGKCSWDHRTLYAITVAIEASHLSSDNGVSHFKDLIAIAQFESVLTRVANENSVLTLEAPEKRESESSGLIFRTGGCNLEGCVREKEISLETEYAAVWAVEPQKA